VGDETLNAIIQEWSNMLAQGQDILIFAEGNHNEPYAAGILQKGFARMTMQFQQKNTALTIIPIGLHYDDHHAFRSRVLVNFGDPIRVSEILKDSVSEREKLETLLTVTDEALKKLALGIKPDEEYKAKFDFLLKYRSVKKDMIAQLEADKNILKLYPTAPASSSELKKSSIVWKLLNPIVWIGCALHILPNIFIKRFIKRKVKDPQFISSLRYALGLIIVPFYYIILLITFYMLVPNIPATLIFGILLPVTGVATADFLKK
jgi:1-acyl-sn-glycerol-3-phosphate acyltransferase